MQKLVKDYLEELRRQKKRRRKAGIAMVLLVVLVVGTVTNGLTQYGIAMTGDYRCGLEEHEHTEECYQDVLICGYGDVDQEEEISQGNTAQEPEAQGGQQENTAPEEGHQHTEDCYEVESVLECALEESEGHTHDEGCYEIKETLTCGQEESEGHQHTEDCCDETGELACGQEESKGHTHGGDCYTSESTVVCGQEESEGHTHGDECYRQDKVLKCGQEESEEGQAEGPAPETPADQEADVTQHTHTEVCYERRPVCGLEEHTHTEECLIDRSADVEDKSVWDALYEDVEWTDSWSGDLVMAAGMQINYSESQDNYQIAEGGSRKGYTRYGEFAGDPYMDWDTAFVNFCMYYAGLTESGLFPDKTNAAEWTEEFLKLQEEREDSGEYLTGPEEYTPKTGDLIFFKEETEEAEETENEEDETALRMGIISSYDEEENEIHVIEGDSGDAVKENTYGVNDEQIDGYLDITELETNYKEAQNPGGVNENGLTEEEQAQVDAVIALIEALPTMEEIEARFAELEEDEEGYAACYQELYEQVMEAKNAYDALTDIQKLAVTNAEKLMQFKWLWTDIMEVPDTELKEHQARITGFTITKTTDGTAPFDNHKEHTAKCYEVNHEGDKNYLICKQHIYTSDDAESVAGDDRSAENLVVRTFDSVNYKFRATMDTYTGSNTAITEARVKLQVILPATKEQASFNLEAMTWVDAAAGYGPQIQNIILDENGGFTIPESENDPAVNGQLLTCWKHLESGRAVIPGFFENNVTVDVKSMKNGETFAPTFYAVLENGFEYDITDGTKVPQLTRGAGDDAKNPEKNDYTYTNEHKCPMDGHGEVEMFRADAPEIRVSAAPKYNIWMAGADAEKRQYNFDDIQPEAQTTVANTGKGFQTGRMVRLGITLQLYNDNASKGLKGIQLPDEDVDITFDLDLKSEYHSHKTPEGEIEKKIDVTGEYTPLLWSCGPNDRQADYGKANIDGRVIYDGYWGNGLAPYSDGAGEFGCQESGTWTATQEGSKISVTVSGYKVDVSNMPLYNQGQDEEVDNPTYGANIGCFSSGVIWILQPFNKEAETDIEQDAEGAETTGNREPRFDVVNKYGEGVFHTTIDENNMQITTSDATTTIVVGNDAQMVKSDDRDTRHLELLLPGVMINQVRYSDKDISKGVGVKSTRNGRDYAALGSEIWLMGGFTYYADRKEENQFYYGTSLVKFYGNAIEPLEDEPIEGQWTATAEGDGGSYVPGHSHLQTYFNSGAKASEISVYYAVKPDGKDWKNDYEMEHTYEDELVFYKHMSEIPKDKVCVGILYCFKGSGNDVKEEQNDPHYQCFHRAIVKPSDWLLGDGSKPVTYAMVSTSRVWTKSMFEKNITWGEGTVLRDLNVPAWNEDGTELSDFPAGHIKSGNIENSTWYERSQYYDDGRGISKEHNSDWSHWGDTLLLIGYKTYITKDLMQKTGGEAKQVFDLDGNQRVVDFRLTPSTGYNLAISQGENSNPNITIPVITIIDTLPKYLRYREGSAYLGGTYRQTAANGGRQGEITGGTPLDQPETEKLTGDDGQTVEALTWNISKPTSVDNEPVIIESEDGSQTLIWRFYNREVGDKLPVIYYSADIGDRGNALTDVPEGTTNLINRVRITAKLDRRHPSVENGNYAEVGIAVTKGAAGAYGKYSFQNAVEEDGVIDYVVYYDNNQDNEIPIALMDNMPFNGVNGSKFTGTYLLTNWKLDQKLCEKSELTVWYTTDTRYKGLTLSDKDGQKNPVITIDEVHGWKKATVAEDGTITCPDLDFKTLEFGKDDKNFLAWAVTGTLAGANCVDISMSIQLIPEKPTISDSATREIYHYVNLFSTKDTITEIDTPTVRRTLEGLTWMDYNRNGIQDQHQNTEEEKLPNVQVTLLKLKDAAEDISEEEWKQWVKDRNNYEPVLWPEGTAKAGEPVTILTGQQISLRQSDCEAGKYETGRYKFTDLPAGYFAVSFTPGEGNADISRMRATIYDVTLGGATDENDSDGVPVYAGGDEKNGKLEQTWIPQIEMEDAETIFYKKYPNYTQTSPYHDSGFYYNPQLNLHKVGENWETKLSGAVFTLADSKGQTITFNIDEDGNYIFPINLGEDVVSGARYYIQYVQEPNLVIGSTSGNYNGAEFYLYTKEEKNDNQLFELFAQQDGTFSFRHCATNRWLDFSGQYPYDDKVAGKIHLWEDANVPTTNVNQKWYVIPNGKGQGQYVIQAAVKRNAGENKGFVDANGAATTPGTLIWGYDGNGTAAQDWRLVPENENSNLKVDANGQLTIKDLLPGEYTLTELETPPGCSLPDHPIKITVKNDGTVEVSEREGSTQISIVDGTSQNNNGTVTNDVKVRNFELYTLPSTGGIGIYWYCISGVLLMAAGVLIQHKRKYAGRC